MNIIDYAFHFKQYFIPGITKYGHGDSFTLICLIPKLIEGKLKRSEKNNKWKESE